jgi:hypothetical protein
MLWGNGTTFPKTAPNSFRVFGPVATWARLRVRWMFRGAVLGIASDMALFGGGGCQEALAAGLESEE